MCLFETMFFVGLNVESFLSKKHLKGVKKESEGQV